MTQETIKLDEVAGEWAEKYSFRIPYDGSNNFYDDLAFKHGKSGFIAGAKFAAAEKDKEMAELKQKIESDYVNIDDLLSEFKRQGFDVSNWNGEGCR